MFGIVTRRRYEADLAAAKAEASRQRRRAETAEGHAATAVYNRKQVLKQNAEQDAANRRLEGRVLELGRRLAAYAEADPEYAASLERRVARLQRVGKRLLAAYALEKHRADKRQALDDDADRKALEEWEKAVTAHDLWQPSPDAERYAEGGLPRPTHPALMLRRALDRCRALDERLTTAEGRKPRGILS